MYTTLFTTKQYKIMNLRTMILLKHSKSSLLGFVPGQSQSIRIFKHLPEYIKSQHMFLQKRVCLSLHWEHEAHKYILIKSTVRL